MRCYCTPLQLKKQALAEQSPRCAIYTRVSTEEQAKEGYSLAAQEERLRAHAKGQGWAVVNIYVDDGYSAASRNRPALKKLLLDGSLKRFDILLVYKIDRLSRSLKDLIEIVAELNDFGVGFKSCTELIDTTRPEGRLMFHQFGSFAQYERELIGQRTRFGMMKRLRQGLWNGQPPYGYETAEEKLVPHGEEAEVVQLIFELYLKKNLGVVGIARELNSRNVKPRKGKMWKGNTIHNIITNPIYAGFVRWGGEMAEGAHMPIVEKGVFDRAQEVLRERNHRSRVLRSPNVLAGLVRCGKCGAPMHVTYPGVEPKCRFRYYVCNNRYYFKSCDQEYIRADILENSVIREIEKLSRRREVIAAIVQDYVLCNRAKRSELEGKKQGLQEQLRRLAEEKTKLSRWILGNDLSADAVRYINTQVDAYNEKEQELQAQIWLIEDEIEAIELMSFNAEAVSGYLRDFCRSYAELETPGERKLLMESLVTKVVIGKNKKVTVILTPPLLGFLTPTLARRGEKPKIDFSIRIEYNVADHYRNQSSTTRVSSSYSKREYVI